jgi:acyl-CoA hydrolase
MTPTPKPPRLSQVEMTEVVLPNDANPLGNMLGGRVLHLIDMAAAIAAIRHAGNPCVTASFDSVDFLTPIPTR